MTKVFGLPIIFAIVLGLLIPYAARQLAVFSFVFLFLLMIWAGFVIEWNHLKRIRKYWYETLVSLVILFLFVPLAQRFLASFFISDQQYLYGITFAALCPIAIVAPFFVQLAKGDKELSYIIMALSTLLSPIVIPLFLKIANVSLPIDTGPLTIQILIFVLAPIFIAYYLQKLFPGLVQPIRNNLSTLNSLTLAALFYILFGGVVAKINTAYISTETILTLIGIAFFQDFFTLGFFRILLPRFMDSTAGVCIAVSVAMKNVAISAGLLLFYDPKAALPSVLVFVSHAVLFNFIPLNKRIWAKKPTPNEAQPS